LLEKTSPDDFGAIWRQLEKHFMSYQEETNWRSFHADVGRLFLEKWNLPQPICEAVGKHHDASLACQTDRKTCLNRIVVLANLISPFTIRNEQVLTQDAMNTEVLRKGLNLSQVDLKNIVKYLTVRTKEESSFLDIDIGSQTDLLVEVNRVVYKHYLKSAIRLYAKRNRNVTTIEREHQKETLREANTAIFKHYLEVERELAHDKALPPRGHGNAWPEINVQPTKIIADKYLEIESLLENMEATFTTKSIDAFPDDEKEQCAGFVVARFPDVDPGQSLHENGTYMLEVGVESSAPKGLDESRFHKNTGKGPVTYEIMVHAEDMNVVGDWAQFYEYEPGGDSEFLSFHLQPKLPGLKRVQVDFLYNNYWMAKIEYELNVLPQIEPITNRE